MGQIIEFLAFLELRRSHMQLVRPYTIPVNFFGACALMAMPMLFIMVIIYFSSTLTLVLAFLCALLGPVAYKLLEIARDRQWCEFEDLRHLVYSTSGDFIYHSSGQRHPFENDEETTRSGDSCSSLHLLGEKSVLLAGNERSRYTQRV